MAMVQPRPPNTSQGLNSLEKSAMAGPNITPYRDNYSKLPVKTAPINVPSYKVADPDHWQNTYGKMQKNSHPDFKPIYGPQDNKRPIDDMLDAYKKTKDQDDLPHNERPKKQANQTPTRGKETKEKMPVSPKRGRETPMKLEDVHDEYDSPKRQMPNKNTSPKQTPEKRQKQPQVLRDQPQKRKLPDIESPASPNRRPYDGINKNSPAGPNIKPYDYNKMTPEGPNIKPYTDYSQYTPVGPNIGPYNNNYERKFPVTTNNLTVPEYKLYEGNTWQKTYPKMQSSSHPDFHPVYGPQDNKRNTYLMDVYKDTKEREKKPEEKKKDTREQKPVRNEEEKTPREDKNKNTPDRSPKKADSPREPRPKEQHKKDDSPRKEDPKKHEEKPKKDTPREQENTKRREEKVPVESPRKKLDNNEEKYYGYEERPVKNDKQEPVNKEVKFTPIVEKRDNKSQDSQEKKDTPRVKKDPYDEWVRDKNKVNERKQDPYEDRRKVEEKKMPLAKRQKEDPHSYRPRDNFNDNSRKQPPRVQPGREAPGKEVREGRTQEPRREAPYVWDTSVKPQRADNILYSSREHMRPTKTQNNNMSIVRDGGHPKLDRRHKPTAKVLPTTRNRGGEKWPNDRRDDTYWDDTPARDRFYQNSDMDDVLQGKIAAPLRESGMPETKVTLLSAKITQAVRDDVIDANQNVSPQVTSNLSEVIHKHLDPIFYNKANVTDLRDAQKANDARHLSNIVLMRVGQVHEEVKLCKLSVDDVRHKRGKAATPREELHDRSMLMAIKDGIEKQKTEKDILRDKLHQAHRDTEEVEDTIHKRQGELQHLDSDNWNLRQDLNNVEQTKQDLMSRLREQEKQCDQLDKQNQNILQENLKLRSRVHETEGQNHNLSSELSKLQSENAKLKVLINQKEKEILHLRDPDKDMVHKIRILSDEVTMLRTQTRRLNEEKAIHKSRSQKMESGLDESNRQKGKLSVERDNLLRENQELKQRYRKLALSNPQNRTLPDITTGRNGPSTYSTPRSNSRAPSRGTRYNNDRMSAAPEDEEDEDDYHR